MNTGSEKISSENYQKSIALSELMFERNNLLEILSNIKCKYSRTQEYPREILVNKFLSKIALINRQIAQVAVGLYCSICHEELSMDDEVLVCQWCGSPAHAQRFIQHVKVKGYCPACGELLKVHYRKPFKTLTQDLIKTYFAASFQQISEVKVFYGEFPLETDAPEKLSLCPECKGQISPNWKFCKYCGIRLEKAGLQVADAVKPCPRCGRPARASWRYCKLCGHPLE